MQENNSIQKAVDILDYLSDHPGGAPLSVISKHFKSPKSTVFNILKTLMKNDFIQYTQPDSKYYCIGSQLYGIGLTYLHTSALFRIASPYMVLMSNKYQKDTFLSKRRHDRAIFIYKHTTLQAQFETLNIGTPRRLHSSAIGKCYLAFDTEAAPLIDTIDLPAITPYTITDRDVLKINLADMRKLGYSLEKRESYIYSACLAAPLFTRGKMIGTISMTGAYKEDEDFTSQGNEIAQFANLISVELEKEKST